MHRQIAAAVLLIFIVMLHLPVYASVCPDHPEVKVIYTDPTTFHQICKASGEALAALAGYSLHPKHPIIIEIVDKGIDSHGYLAYGSYDSRSDRIKLMSYRSIVNSYENPQMYDEFFDHVHYSGAIAHEIAHAVFQQHTTAVSPGTANQEYLAHAIQLSVMPRARREKMIERMDVEAWLSGDAISDIYMALEPGRFAVKSYKHLTTTSDPEGFIGILLNSKWFYVYIP